MKEGVCENISHDVTNTTTSAIEAFSDDINNINISNNNITLNGAADSISPGTSTSTSDSCNKVEGASKPNDNILEIGQLLSIVDDNLSICANCGKEGDDIKNICNKCKKATYCNAACKKKHRHKHKIDCEEHVRLATEKHNEELRLAAEKHDEELFKQPPPKDDCPICFIRLPSLDTGRRYQTCCGKLICSGCSYAPVYDDQGNKVDDNCPFCRTPRPKSNEEAIARDKARMEKDDPIAIHNQGSLYREGGSGHLQDYTKALELFHRAAELGHAGAYNSIAYCYHNGYGLEVDKKKANHYYELAAMRGNERARHNIGNNEYLAGNIIRALTHYKIAVQSGEAESLKVIQLIYKDGHATKDDYTTAIRSYQTYLGEIKSKQRDEAATHDYENYRYY